MKGQLEMVGVLIIVVLLLFLGIIFVVFVANKPESVYSDIRLNIKASNIVNALLKVDYNGNKLSYAIVECSKTLDCNGVKNKIVEVMQLLKETNYIFKVKDQDNEPLKIGNCTGNKISYNYPLTLEGKDLKINLVLCS